MSGPLLLDRVLAPGGLSVTFQPILDLQEEKPRLHALECLLRGPKGTNVESAPVLFDYVRAKREELAVDRACVEAALEAARELEHEPHLNLNVHASSLSRDPEFPAFLSQAARSRGIPPSRLTVEIVEHAPPFDTPAFLKGLQALTELGAELALDDVGLGQSNFRMILDCRPHYFKIDRYFVDSCHEDPYRRAVMESLAQLARRFNARVVAEGVTSQADLETIKALGITLVQGWLFAPAMTAAELNALKLPGITRPTRTTADERRAEEPSPKTRTAMAKRILLVDDSYTALMIERTILGQAGYELVTAKDGEEAIAKATTEKPDLILMDLVMPKMTGLEACQELRRREQTSTVPIIMVTTRGEQKHVEAAFSLGCTDYITKPINGLELLEKLRNYLGE